MPILAALTTALPYITAAWQIGSQYLNKPKKSDYVPTGSMYNRYLAHLKSKTTDSTVFHQRMRPALRQIGQQTQRAQRQVGQFVSRRKPGGGVEAQMRMGINKQALEAIGIASEKASVAQEQVNERTGEQLLRIGVQEEQQLQQYQRAKRQFSRDTFRTAAYIGVSLADIASRNAVARKRAIGKTIAGAEATQAKSDEQIKTDYNSTSESFRQETSFDEYLQDVRAMSTEITTKLVEPTKDDISFRKGGLKAAREHRKQFEKGTQDWKDADAAVKAAKENLSTARQDFREAKTTYDEDIDKYVTVEKESTGGLAPFAGTTQQISAAYVGILKERAESEEEFQKDERLEKIEGDSFEVLRQLTERLEKLGDPTQAYAEYDKVKHLLSRQDKGLALTKIESTFPDLIHDDPFERRTAIIGTTNNSKRANKNVTDVIIGGGTSAQIKAAGDVARRIENDKIAEDERVYREETRQTAKDKKVLDAETFKRDIVIDRNSFKEFFGQFYTTHRPEKTTTGEKLEVRRFGREYKKRGEALIQTIDALGEKPLTPSTAKGLQRQVREFAAFVDTDNQQEQIDLKIFLAKLGTSISDKEFAEWEEKIRGMTGVTSRELSSWTLEMMKRIDAMARNERYVPDISKPRLEGF